MVIPSHSSVNSNSIPITGYPNHLIPSIMPSNSINNNSISSNNNNMHNYLVHYYPTTSMYNHHLNSRMPTDRFPSIVAPQPPPHMVYTGQSSSRYPVQCNIDQCKQEMLFCVYVCVFLIIDFLGSNFYFVLYLLLWWSWLRLK